MITKEQKTLTVNEALAEGYTVCMRDGYSHVSGIADLEDEDIKASTYWICDKEDTPIGISADTIQDLIISHFDDQTEVADEDGELGQLVGKMDTSVFEAVATAVSEQLSTLTYWMTTDIQLTPNA